VLINDPLEILEAIETQAPARVHVSPLGINKEAYSSRVLSNYWEIISDARCQTGPQGRMPEGLRLGEKSQEIHGETCVLALRLRA
jgi:hypothetical protein